MEKLIQLLSNPEVAAAAFGFVTILLTIGLAVLRKMNVLTQIDIDFAVSAIQKAKAEAGDMGKIVSHITDNTRLNVVQVNKLAAEVVNTPAGDTSSKKAQRIFRNLIRKGLFGF